MSRSMMLFQRIKRLFFPPRCPSCATLSDWYAPNCDASALFCPDCLNKWQEARDEICEVCRKKVSACGCVTEEMKKAKCESFRKLVYYRHARADAVQNRLIFFLKRTRNRDANRAMAGLLLPALSELQSSSGTEASEQCLTFIPRSRTARAEYGTDQAEELALALAELSGLPMRRLIVRNRGKNKQQKSLSPQERQKNAKESFRLSKNAEICGKTVFLVDDIVTTGASMAACARMLKRAGAKHIYALAIASDDANRDRY